MSIKSLIKPLILQEKKLLVEKEAKLANFGGKLCSYIDNCERTLYDAGFGNCIVKFKRENIVDAKYDLVILKIRYGAYTEEDL